jgi:hypothetical protein
MVHANVLSTQAGGTITTEAGTALALETKSGAQFSSSTSAQMSVFNTETVVIDRPSSGASRTFTVIYTGECDFQSSGGSEYINPAGPVDIADGLLMIDADSSGYLPTVKVGDRATITQNGIATVYNVVNTAVYTFAYPHLELAVKRGPIETRPSVRR